MNLSKIFFTCHFLLVSLSSPLSGFAAGDPHSALIEGAQKETKLMIYSSVSATDTATLSRRFRQKYPFVKPEFLRLGSERLLTRILQEARGANSSPTSIKPASSRFIYSSKRAC